MYITEYIEVDQPQSEDDIDYSKKQKLEEDLSKEKKKIKDDELYKALKNSVINNNIAPLESITLIDQQSTTKECCERLKKLTNKSDYHTSCVNQINCEKGRILSVLKGKCKKDYVSLATKEGFETYCKSYCEHLIRFYKICQDFPRLKYSSLAGNFFKNNMKIIVPCLEKDPDFWKI